MSGNASDPMNTMLNPYMTYQWDKYSCISGMYFAHIVFCYLIMVAGFGCLFSRFLPHTQWTHKWFGRLYIMSMLWGMGTSMLIHNSGLPAAVLVSFLWVAAGICFGWPIINFHQMYMQKAATRNVAEQIKVTGNMPSPDELENMINAEKGRIAANKTWMQRVFSLKAAHGAFMVTSWVNIIGRVFVTPLGSDFTCYTATYYKQIDTKWFQGADQPVTAVPTHNPDFYKLPWAKMGTAGWGALLLLAPLLGSWAIGMIWAAVAARKAKKAAPVAESEKDLDIKTENTVVA